MIDKLLGLAINKMKSNTIVIKWRVKIILKIEALISPPFPHRLQRIKRKPRVTTTTTKVAATIKPIVLVCKTTKIYQYAQNYHYFVNGDKIIRAV